MDDDGTYDRKQDASGSDDDFEKVTTDKKRAKERKPEAPVIEANPKFPASDPTKVKVINV